MGWLEGLGKRLGLFEGNYRKIICAIWGNLLPKWILHQNLRLIKAAVFRCRNFDPEQVSTLSEPFEREQRNGVGIGIPDIMNWNMSQGSSLRTFT